MSCLALYSFNSCSGIARQTNSFCVMRAARRLLRRRAAILRPYGCRWLGALEAGYFCCYFFLLFLRRSAARSTASEVWEACDGSMRRGSNFAFWPLPRSPFVKAKGLYALHRPADGARAASRLAVTSRWTPARAVCAAVPRRRYSEAYSFCLPKRLSGGAACPHKPQTAERAVTGRARALSISCTHEEAQRAARRRRRHPRPPTLSLS